MATTSLSGVSEIEKGLLINEITAGARLASERECTCRVRSQEAEMTTDVLAE